jgi:predicted dehydrogenase
MENRREFIKKVAVGSAGIAVGGPSFGFSAKSYKRIVGANALLRVATIGVNSRGNSMSGTFAGQKNAEVGTICDVDERAIPKAIATVKKNVPSATPKSERDCRKVLEDKSIDAIYIATPDHWHAPLTIMGCQAGKHVYVEKPLSHNPREGELAVEAARKYNKVVQMGAQRR